MKLDTEIQRKLLIQITEQAKISGNYKEVLDISKQITDLINTIKNAPLESNSVAIPTEKNNRTTKIIA